MSVAAPAACMVDVGFRISNDIKSWGEGRGEKGGQERGQGPSKGQETWNGSWDRIAGSQIGKGCITVYMSGLW